ncbi:kelch-like protein 10 [Contarinia nasturtii]|uniref:kelch-like protein 10 n=1 Tax=Contarinia nasturtii TaxID=265458 RepID=UPI0012D43DD6|nr:kelch-like protein 10 [Contarinia nasturtii]
MDIAKQTKLHSNNIINNCMISTCELNELRKSNIYCDANILLDDGGSIPIHRIILSNATEFFYKLFMSPLNAEQQRNYHIRHIRTHIMETVIDFAYTLDCDINETNLWELLTTADYFCYSLLIDRCTEFIRSILNLENAIHLLLMTRKWLYKHEIERSIREYILRNFIEIFQSNDVVLNLSVEDLVDILKDDALNTKTEEPIWELCLRWIEFDEKNRPQYVPQLLACIRLGLMNKAYFEQRVLNNKYVRLCPEAEPIIHTAYRFVSDMDQVDWHRIRDNDLSMLVPRLPNDLLFALGGWFNGTACDLFETYDIRADRWLEFYYKDPLGPRAYLSTSVIGYNIYCIGGFSGNVYHNRCSVFNLETKDWTEIAPMHYRRCYVSVCTLNGKVYAMGGHDGHNRLTTTEVYCPETNQWTLLSNMEKRRSDADACELDGKIYIIGGFDGIGCLNCCEVYNPETNEWSNLPEMTSARSGLKCVAYKGKIFAIGGYNGITRMSSCEAYDPNIFYWSPISDMLCPRSNFGIEVIDDAIYVVGGFDGLTTINKVEYYRDENKIWVSAVGLNHNRSAHALAKVTNCSNIEDFVFDSRAVSSLPQQDS